MGLRFRRSLRLFPGVRLNFSRSGISTTVGVRGASITLGPKGNYLEPVPKPAFFNLACTYY